MQAHSVGAVLLGQETQHGLWLPVIATSPADVPHGDSPAGAAAHQELPARVQIEVDALVSGHLPTQGPQRMTRLPEIPAQKFSILSGS